MSSFDSPLSSQDLVALLIKHGIVCRNYDEELLLRKRIETVGYYRLEEYSWPFRRLNLNDRNKRTAYFKQRISFDLIWRNYLFDRRLRFLLLDAIERFEIAVRGAIVQLLTAKTGTNIPQSDTSLFPAMLGYDGKSGKTKYQRWMAGIQSRYDESGTYDPRVEHCKTVHGITNVADLPFWIFMELTTLGNLKMLYESLRPDLKLELASQLDVEAEFLTSSFILLHQVRNRCAHHKRIWNYLWVRKKLSTSENSCNQRGRRPLFAYKVADQRWHLKYDAPTSEWIPDADLGGTSFNPKDTVFVFILCGFWLDRVAQTSHWKQRVEQTVQPNGDLLRVAAEAGFCPGWQCHPIWRP